MTNKKQPRKNFVQDLEQLLEATEKLAKNGSAKNVTRYHEIYDSFVARYGSDHEGQVNPT
jgi:hypothetical protein